MTRTDGATSDGVLSTVIVTPRERFGVAIESLRSIVEHTEQPYRLIYVDAGAPKRVSDQIAEICAENGFTHLRYEHYLSPNQSRNAGYRAADTRYVAFIDNDVIVSKDWLNALIDCAEETSAEVVTPLTCQKLPLHTEIHQAGGRFTDDLQTFFTRPVSERRIDEEHVLQGKMVSEVSLERGETHCCEFHCALVRRDVLDAIGGLDEGLLATKEHIDFCMTVWKRGGRVMFEPSSVVTYLFPNRASPLAVEDWPFFALRWSPTWQKRSLDHFQRKWELFGDPYFEGRQGMLSWRHREGIGRPLVRKIPWLGQLKSVQRYGSALVARVLNLWSMSLVRNLERSLRTSAPGE
ncbi:MAG: glycosyltransferase [Pseudomonadota bacterium]